jgi:hypothetical protein
MQSEIVYIVVASAVLLGAVAVTIRVFPELFVRKSTTDLANRNARYVSLDVRVSPEGAMSRILHAGDEERLALTLSFFTGDVFAGEKPFLVTRSGMRFTVQKRRLYRNVMHPLLFGRIEPTPAGSRITGYFAMSWLVRMYQTVWLASSLLWGLCSAVTGIPDYLRGGVSKDDFVISLMPWIMFFGGYVVSEIGWFLSAKEKPEICEWLHGVFPDSAVDPSNGSQRT